MLLYCPFYAKHLEEYTKTSCPRGLIAESVTEDKVWVFLLYQAHRDKRKQGRILKDYETRISTQKIDTKDGATMLRRILTGTTELVENRDRSQFHGYSQHIDGFLYTIKKENYTQHRRIVGFGFT